MILKFGKHKGKDIKDVPTEYLSWVITTLDLSDKKFGEQNKLLMAGCNQVINERTDATIPKRREPVKRKPAGNELGTVLADIREEIGKIYEAADNITQNLNDFHVVEDNDNHRPV